MTDNELIAALELALERFSIPLRMGEGLNDVEFSKFCEVVKQCGNAWQERDSIPKKAVLIFVDIYSAMESTSYLYEGKYRQQIMMKADELADLIRQCAVN